MTRSNPGRDTGRDTSRAVLLAKRDAREREFFIDNLLVRIHFIIVMIRWTGLAPWEFEFPLPGSLISSFLVARDLDYRGTSLIRNTRLLGPYSRTIPRALWWS